MNTFRTVKVNEVKTRTLEVKWSSYRREMSHMVLLKDFSLFYTLSNESKAESVSNTPICEKAYRHCISHRLPLAVNQIININYTGDSESCYSRKVHYTDSPITAGR